MTGVQTCALPICLVKLASKAIDMVTGALDRAIDRYDTLNNFPRVMQQMGFDAGESQKAVQRLSDGIQGLPTTLDSVVKTAQRIAIMTKDLDGAVETTLALNNAFLASGASSADAARGLEQYVQMLSKGTVDLESWRTLQETMGVALNEVAEAFGFAGASAQNDLYKALSSGRITFDEFNKKLIELSNQTGGFAERALTATGGIRTAWTNMRTAVVRGVTNIIEAIDSVLADTQLKSIQNIITNIGKSFFNVLDGIAGAIPKIAEKIKEIHEILKPWYPLLNGIVAVVLAISVAFFTFQKIIAITTAVKTGIQALRASMAALNATMAANPIALVIGLLAGLAALFVYLYKTSEPFRNVVNQIGETLKGIFSSAVERVSQLIDGLRERFSGGIPIMEKVSGVFQKIGSAIAAVAEFILNSKIIPLFESLTDAISKAFSGDFSGLTKLFAQFIPTIVGLLLGGVPKLIFVGAKFLPAIAQGLESNMPMILDVITNIITGLIDEITTYLPIFVETGVEVLTNLINGLTTAIPMILPVIITVITTIIETIAKFLPVFLESGIQILTKLMEGLVAALPLILDVVLTILTTFITLIAENLPMIIEAGTQILNALIDGVISILPMLITTALTLIVTLASALIENLPTIIDAGIKILKALIDGIIKVLPQLIQAGIQLIISLADAIIKNLPEILAAGGQILMALIDGIVKLVPQLLELGWELVKDLGKAIIDKVPDMMEAGADLIRGLWDGIKSVKDWILRKIGGFVDDIVGGIKKFFKIGSPSKLMANEVGRWIPAGLVEGIEKEERSAIQAMKRLGASLSATITPSVNVSDSLRGASLPINLVPTVAMASGGYVQGGVTGGMLSTERFYSLISAILEMARRPVSVQIDGREFIYATVDDFEEALNFRQKRRELFRRGG